MNRREFVQAAAALLVAGKRLPELLRARVAVQAADAPMPCLDPGVEADAYSCAACGQDTCKYPEYDESGFTINWNAEDVPAPRHDPKTDSLVHYDVMPDSNTCPDCGEDVLELPGDWQNFDLGADHSDYMIHIDEGGNWREGPIDEDTVESYDAPLSDDNDFFLVVRMGNNEIGYRRLGPGDKVRIGDVGF